MQTSAAQLRANSKWRLKNPDYVKKYIQTPSGRKSRLRGRLYNGANFYGYKITVDEYERIEAQQDNKCAICKKEEIRKCKGTLLRLAVDHNHKTGKVRGLLCRRCNQTLGNVEESIMVLKQMIEYLQEKE